MLRVAPGNPVILSGTAGEELAVRLDRPGQEQPDPIIWQPLRGFDAASGGEKGEVRWLRFWLIAPSGAIAASGALPADQSIVIRLPAEQTGLYALMTEAGPGSLGISSPTSRALMAVARSLEFEDPNEKLCFYVPPGADKLSLTTGGLDQQVHMKVFDSAGDLRFQRDDFNVHSRQDTIEVPAGQDGKVWVVNLSTDTPPARRAGRRTKIEFAEPLQGFVSPEPGRLVVLD